MTKFPTCHSPTSSSAKTALRKLREAWCFTNDSLTTSVFCAVLKFWQIKKALKIK